MFLCGTPDFALETLKEIYKGGHNILAVVCQPDKQVGRGMQFKMPPTKEFALENDIKVLQPAKLRNNEEFFDELRALKPDIIVVVAYGKILPIKILELPKYGCMNVHGSLLPKYRGAAPIQWAIINGDEVTGVTTMKMDAGMDTGDIYLTEEVKIEKEDTYGTLYEKLKKVGAKLASKTLDAIVEGRVKAKKQPDDFTVAPMIFKEDCKIDYLKSAFAITNLVRGVNPSPGAWTTLDGVVYKFWDIEEVDESICNFEGVEGKDTPGKVICSNSKKGLFIATASGIISVKEIQAPNAKRMNVLDFLRGNKIEEGKIFN